LGDLKTINIIMFFSLIAELRFKLWSPQTIGKFTLGACLPWI